MAVTLGYLVPEFPSQTHAFFWREVAALRSLGIPVFLISTRRPAPGTCRHAFAHEAQQQTRYLFPPRWLQVVLNLALHPVQLIQCLRYILTLSESSLLQRVKLFGLLFAAAELSMFSRANGINHIHVHSCANAAHVARIAKLLGGPKYSLTLHGDLGVYGTDHRQKAIAAEFVSCVTKPLQSQVRDVLGLSPKRSPLLWMGVDTERFKSRGSMRTTQGQLQFLTVARLNYTKGHRYALRALRKVLDQGVSCTYLIAGEGPERSSIEIEMAKLNLESHVQLLGTCSEDEVLDLLQRSDILLLTSIGAGEAAPVSVMEAMACSLPVVCSVIGGTPDMISDGVDGFLVKQEDVDGLAQRMLALAHDQALRERMGHAARQRAMAEFDSVALAKRFVTLLESAS